jgi:hypothetical protein
MLSYFTSNAEHASSFVAKYRRPFPWFELVETSQLESLAYLMSRRLRLTPLSGDFCVVCHAAASRMKFERPGPDQQQIDDDVELLSAIVGRCGIDLNSTAYYAELSGTIVAHVRLRDLVEFEQLLWREDHFLVGSEGDWIVNGSHNTLAGFVRLS